MASQIQAIPVKNNKIDPKAVKYYEAYQKGLEQVRKQEANYIPKSSIKSADIRKQLAQPTQKSFLQRLGF